jgi:hypothetical protein
MEGNTPKWQRFKQLSPLLQGVSPSESFFGHSKLVTRPQPPRACGCHRRTWVDEAQPHLRRQDFLRTKQNRLLLLMLRRAASRRAAIRQQQIEQTKALGELHRLQTMETRRDYLPKRKERAQQMGREAVERDMPLPTKAEYEAVRKLEASA